MNQESLYTSLHMRQMSRDELDILVGWAALEGWNPGRYDADIFWNTDPEGFIAAEIDGEFIGGGSIVSYRSSFGFMGFFIVKPEYRGKGLGDKLWFARRNELESRLNTPLSIGMDGVFTMQPYYSKGGFKFSHRDIRFEGQGKRCKLDDSLIAVSSIPIQKLLEYDSKHFPSTRMNFLKAWVSQPESQSLAVMKDEKVCGYGVIRRCKTGYKIGPLFADDPEIALNLFNGLSDHAVGEPLFLDVPENNDFAMSLVKMKDMKEVFGCAKMYFGMTPSLPHEEIYGVTTFELG